MAFLEVLVESDSKGSRSQRFQSALLVLQGDQSNEEFPKSGLIDVLFQYLQDCVRIGGVVGKCDGVRNPRTPQIHNDG